MNFIQTLKYLTFLINNGKRPLEKPVVLQLPVNDICNSRCQMCHIWKQPLDKQISAAELENVLQKPLFSEVRAVGINGGEPTLRADLVEISRALLTLPKLRSVSLITNALNHKQVIRSIESLGVLFKEYKIHLDVMVSLDGVGDVHDAVRGREGNFHSAVKVVEFCKGSPLVSSLRLGCTVIHENIYGLHDLLDFAIQQDVYIKFRLGIPHKRLYSDNLSDIFSLTKEEKLHFCSFLDGVIRQYEKSELQKFFYKSLIDQLLRGKPRAAGCDWQHRGVTISSSGHIFYCAVQSSALGSLLEEESESLYFGNEEHLRQILNRHCPTCSHDYMGYPPLKVAIKHFLGKAFAGLGLPLTLARRKLFSQFFRVYFGGFLFSRRLKQFKVMACVNRSSGASAEKATGYPKKVMIVGWYGTETLGDKVILGGIVESLQHLIPQLEIDLVSLDKCLTESTLSQMPELGNLSVCSIEEGLSKLSHVDLLLFGGGPLMAIDNMAEMQVFFEQAKKNGVKCIVAGCGVGPLGPKYLNKSIGSVLSLADYSIFRDDKAKLNAGLLGIDNKSCSVAEDPAFTWLFNRLGGYQTRANTNNGKPFRLLLGLRDWPVDQYASHLRANTANQIKDRYEHCLVEFIKRLAKEHDNVEFLPFPMCTNSQGGDDRWYLRELFRREALSSARVDTTCLSAELSPVAALEVFRSVDAAITMRFHSLVFCLALGVPTIAIDYTLGAGKVASLAARYGVPFKSIDQMTDDFLMDEMSSILHGACALPEIDGPQFPSQLHNALQKIFL